VKKNKSLEMLAGFLLLAVVLSLVACGGGGGGGDDDDDGGSDIPATSQEYVLLAWSEAGMHCLNPNYDTAVILPPYNSVWAQVIKRDTAPEIVTRGLTLEYRLINNTSSADKTYAPFDSVYGQFWQYALDLFGVDLALDTGLNLKDPDRHNGLTGTMVVYGNHYEVNGVPATPVDDAGVWNPYQVMEITAKDGSGAVIARTRTTVPTSDEINCIRCHNDGGDPFADILADHDRMHATNLSNSKPVLCADCHGSPALGGIDPGEIFLSEAIHGSHANRGITSCYDCHPGATTQCNRSQAHTAPDGNCTACHGTMQQVADSIADGRRPWTGEPKCVTCHAGVAEVDTGATLYKDAVGHGNLGCPACHGSPHAMVPSREATDNYQALQYQDAALSLGSCAVCHRSSRGGGSNEFLEEHGGTRNPTACNVCHTSINTANTALWPHRFQWEAR
jgi:hypothetical protein